MVAETARLGTGAADAATEEEVLAEFSLSELGTLVAPVSATT